MVRIPPMASSKMLISLLSDACPWTARLSNRLTIAVMPPPTIGSESSASHVS